MADPEKKWVQERMGGKKMRTVQNCMSKLEATRHMWLVSIWNVTLTTELYYEGNVHTRLVFFFKRCKVSQ